MNGLIEWLEAHDKLSGWAQFVGAMLALLLTYFTAFAPIWRRKRQLHQSGLRLLSHGHDAIESYHRTSQQFLPFALSIRGAVMTMKDTADQIDRFPIFELDDHGPRSLARYLVSTAMTLRAVVLFLEPMEAELAGRDGTVEDQANIRTFLAGRLEFIQDMLSGKELKRPEWPAGEAATRNNAVEGAESVSEAPRAGA